MSLLVLLRHGQSQWNLENRFTGWVDVPLSNNGRKEAVNAGRKIKNINFAIAYTSVLSRAIETLLLACSQTNTGKTPIFIHTKGKLKKWQHHSGNFDSELPVIMNKALNERYYGDLQGLNKDEAKIKWGKKQVRLWRRSYAIAPPGGESLKDTTERILPYLKKNILHNCQQDKNVLVVAHGNSLRGIVKFLENISDKEIPNVEIETGIPWVYEINQKKQVISKKIYA